jgi:hypothetical protein
VKEKRISQYLKTFFWANNIYMLDAIFILSALHPVLKPHTVLKARSKSIISAQAYWKPAQAYWKPIYKA